MKLQLEEISESAHSSFRIMVNPNLSNFFFWHFHPELELTYIEGTHGTRHVGEHISGYKNSDLVLIGSNLPHLNFDYGVKTSYSQTVIHLRPDFLSGAVETMPEFQKLKKLFEQSEYALSFGEQTKKRVGSKMIKLHLLDHFQQLLEIINILHDLAMDPQKQLLHQTPVKKLYGKRDQARLSRIYHYIDLHYQQKMELEQVAALCHLTKEAFCRYFRKMTKLTFTQFVNHYRIEVAKKLLLQGSSITDACFDCGFESISYFNRIFKRITGTSPTGFKRKFLSASG